MTSDRGGAPCAPPPPAGTSPLLSLAICKPAVRRTASPGDRIVGLTSRALEQRDGYPALSVIYTATVTEVLDATAYYAMGGPYGSRPDCIYRYEPETGRLNHSGETGLHADSRHRRRDLGREGIYENGRILLCREFTYLGCDAAVLPERLKRLRELASSLGQGHRVVTAGEDASLDAELTVLFQQLGRRACRYTPWEVHADAYDHPAAGTAERVRSPRSTTVCTL